MITHLGNLGLVVNRSVLRCAVRTESNFSTSIFDKKSLQKILFTFTIAQLEYSAVDVL